MISQLREESFEVKESCLTLGASRSGYYQHLKGSRCSREERRSLTVGGASSVFGPSPTLWGATDFARVDCPGSSLQPGQSPANHGSNGVNCDSTTIVQASNEAQPPPIGLQCESALGWDRACDDQSSMGGRHHLRTVAESLRLLGIADGFIFAADCGLGPGAAHGRRLGHRCLADGDSRPATGPRVDSPHRSRRSIRSA